MSMNFSLVILSLDTVYGTLFTVAHSSSSTCEEASLAQIYRALYSCRRAGRCLLHHLRPVGSGSLDSTFSDCSDTM